MSNLNNIKKHTSSDFSIYNTFVSKIKNQDPFAFSRFGDGEFKFILNRNLKPEWGTKVRESGLSLKNIFCRKGDPNYFIGIQPLSIKLFEIDILKLMHPEGNYINSDILHIASIKNNLHSLMEVIKQHPKSVLVGPDYLKSLNIFNKHISVPKERSWESVDNLYSEIKNTIKELKNSLIVFCASAASNLLIDLIWQEEQSLILIDAGSIFEPYVGINIRGYHSTILDRLNTKPS